jgi:MSHA biogenesis protein MshI
MVGMGLFTRLHKGGQWLAICIADDGWHALSVRHAVSGKPTVTLAMFQALEKGLPTAGLEKFGKQLRAKKYRCTTLLEQGQYQFLSVDAPSVPPEEMKEAVRWRLKDMIDFPVDQATIDMVDVPVSKGPGVRNQTLFAVAAQNSIIEQRQTLFSNAKIALTTIDIAEMAQRNVSAMLEPEGRGMAMLSFSADGGLLTVTYGGALYLSRRIDVSLAQLLAIEDQPGFEKSAVGNIEPVMDEDQAKKQANKQLNAQLKATDAQLAIFDKITLELQRSLDHCDRQYHFIVVDKLMLAPIVAPRLQAHLAANMYLPVAMLDLAEIVDLSDAPHLLNPQQQQRFFMCLGAALRQEESAS